MIKHARNIAVAAAASCLLALPAQANVAFNAQFLELWPFEDSGDPLVDLFGDQFGFSFGAMDAGSYDITVDGVVVTYNSGITNDLFQSASLFSESGSAVPDIVGIDPVDALFLPFVTNPFMLGDSYFVTIDVDDEDAYVPGSAFFGSTIEVFYTDNNAAGGPLVSFAEGTFGACSGDEDPNGVYCASASVMIDATPGDGGTVPAPMSLALLGIGLLGLGWRRRK